MTHAITAEPEEIETRDCCAVHPTEECEPDCSCSDCDNERALDNDADAWADRW